ncbi:MAG: PilZ domain-containing protein [Pyrinomonadaceae bacterium]
MTNKLEHFKEKVRDFVERRSYPRLSAACEVQLPIGVSMPNERIDPEAEHYPLPIMGQTRDVSEDGMSVIIPSVVLGDERVDVPGYPLRLVLSLPTGLLIVQAATVRAEPVRREDGTEAHVLGLSITKISPRDRNMYQEFLRSCV